MHLRNKIFRFVLLAVVALTLATMEVHAPRSPARQYLSHGLPEMLPWSLGSVSFNQAHASGDILASGQAQQIRFLYMLINGPGPNGYPAGMDGPEGGLLGIIRMITGPDALGGGLRESGYALCSQIPDTGEASMTDIDGTYRMVFATPLKTIPSGYTGAGGVFDKRVTVQFNGVTFMNIEFNCDTNVGWVRLDEPGMSPARSIEAYWDTENSSAARLELYMYYEVGLGSGWGNEYFFAKFQTEANNRYKFFILRAVDKTGTGNDEGFRVAARGDTSTDVVNAYMLIVPNITDNTTDHTDTGSVATGDVTCLDVSAPAAIGASAGCGSLGLDASTGAPLIDGGDSISVSWIADTVNGMKADMTALVDP